MLTHVSDLGEKLRRCILVVRIFVYAGSIPANNMKLLSLGRIIPEFEVFLGA
jgi:hypothetical protein